MNYYKRDEVYKETLEYFNGDQLATDVWINKYALKDSDGNIYEKTPDDMHNRIASELNKIEKKYPNPLSKDKIFELIKNFKYLVPQGGSMSGLGNNNQVVSLSNCFVIGNVADSYGGIFLTDQEQAQLMKRRGGVGHDLSHIRPSGTNVNNSALTSTGIVPFMERYSNTTREVAQDGRRGALMLSISINHPNSSDFIDAKLDTTKITGANISVKIDDSFMKSLEKNDDYIQSFPINKNIEIDSGVKKEDLKNDLIVKGALAQYKKIKPKKIWNKIIHNAWKSAEPGILFWDNILNESVADSYSDQGFETVSTNPCGEITLCPYDSCRLLAINLYSYVENPFTKEATFNWDLFKEHVRYAQRFMDDIVDLEIEKIDKILEKIKSDPEDEFIKQIETNLWEKIKDKAVNGRRTGLGVTAEGDMLASLGLTYGTKQATDFSIKVHKTLAIEAYVSSTILAKERGAFPIYAYEKENNSNFIKRIRKESPELDKMLKSYGRRNISLLTIAPTGSVSIMTSTTSGIEPVFLPAYKRRRKINPNDKETRSDFIDSNGDNWEEYTIIHPKFKYWLELSGYNLEDFKKMKQDEIDNIIKKSPYYKATSNDVDWHEKVRMQGEIQKWVDHSISVTINLPNETTEKTVDELYRTAWKSGCKGLTIYRDGSRDGVLIKENNKKSINEYIKENNAQRRPKILECEVVNFVNNKEKWIGFLGMYEDKENNEAYPYELFTGLLEAFPIPSYVEKGWIKKNKDKNTNKATFDFVYLDKDRYEVTMSGLNRAFDRELWNISKMISAMLRHKIHLPTIISLVDSLQLNGNKDEHTNPIFGTWQAGVKRILKKYLKSNQLGDERMCPVCGSTNLIRVEGCLTCNDCQWSKCG